MDGGGEGKIDKEENGSMGWLYAAAMTVDGGVAVGLRLCFMARAVKNKERVGIQGGSACTFSTRLYGDLWEHITYIFN